MSYQLLATSTNPALIVYVLDVSASMSEPMGHRSRIEVVADALGTAIRQMVFRSTKGRRVSPRYRLAIYAYSDHVYDILDGIKTVDIVAREGIPSLTTMRLTRTARAFAEVEKMLTKELPNLRGCPAPLVCHMTDGEFTGDDPEPIVKRIRAMSVGDGNVLVENIFISEEVMAEPISDPHRWPGITDRTALLSNYAHKLRGMSSVIPDSYRRTMAESNYHLDADARMMLPGSSPELVAMGFQMSAATPIG